MFELSLLEDFLIETREHLAELESDLLKLETNPDRRDVLDDIFRSIHTIKGAAGFVGLEKISELSHKLENLMELLRQGQKQVNRDIVDTLIEGKDHIALLVEDLQRSQVEETLIDDLVARIVKLTESPAGDIVEQASGTETEAVSRKAVETEKSLTPPKESEIPFLEEEEELILLEDLVDAPAVQEKALPEAIGRTSTEKIDFSLLEDFLTEAGEHLIELESDLLQLETDPDCRDILDDTFRSIHTIKGAAEFVGLEKISELSHKIENLLELLRQGHKQVNRDIIDTLIEGKDRIALLVDELQCSQVEETLIDDLVARIVQLTESPAGDGADEQASCEENETVARKAVEAEEAEGADTIEQPIHEEEYDQELFSIFLKQLNENISFLRSQLEESDAADNKCEVLERCAESIESLKSSANYMDYQELVLIYQDWLAEINELKEEVSESYEITFEFMTAYIDKVVKIFPQAGDSELEKKEDVAVEKQEETLNFDDELEGSLPQEDALTFLAESDAHPQEDGDLTSIEELENAPSVQDIALPPAPDLEALQDTSGVTSAEKIDLSLLQDFLVEVGEHLSELESNLLQLETEPDRRDILDGIFRSTHTIKGSAEFVGIEKISELSHKLENLMELLRQGQKQVNEDIIDTLIEAKDRIALLVEDLKRSQAEETLIDDLVARIRQLTESPTGDIVEQASGTETEAVSSKAVEAEKTKGTETVEEQCYEEECDPELLGIFIGQLKENISFLRSQFEEPDTSDNMREVLERCADSIESLKSSANYMDYQKLVSIYKDWLNEIDGAKGEWSEGEEISLGFMEVYIDKIFKVFPQADELETQLEGEASGEKHAETMTFLNESEESLVEKEDLISLGELEGPLLEDDSLTSIDELEEPLFEEEELNSLGDSEGRLLEEDSLTSLDELERPLLAEEDLNSLGESEGPLLEEDSLTSLDELEEPLFEEEELNSLGESEGSLLEEGLNFLEESEIVPEAAGSASDDNTLFETLGTAFDASTEEAVDAEPDLLTGVINEMLSTDAETGVVEPPSAEVPQQNETPQANLKQSGAEKDAPLTGNLPPSAPSADKSVKPEDASNRPSFSATNANEGALENLIKRPKSDSAGNRILKQSVRVSADKIDSLMNQVGELVVSRAFFSQLANEMKTLQQHLKEEIRLDQKQLKPVRTLSFRLGEAIVSLGRVANDLQEGVMKVRMLPISQLFNRYPRLVRDLSHNSDKQVHLEIKGGETELDKMIIEEISDPLIHIIRNAVDHGIETRRERRQAGKPENGTLTLEAYHESNHIVIEITDDGRGLDPDHIKAKALGKGFLSKDELNRMSDKELTRIIMVPGFSTAEKVSHTSGRGVGMDVVKKNIEKLNGTIEINSTPGVKTQMRIKIPLTLAIIQALMVRVGSDLYTIPLSAVEETLRISGAETSLMEGVEVIHMRNRTMPIFRLSDMFGLTPDKKKDDRAYVVIVSTGMQQIGLVVDELVGQEEVVIKPLVDYLQENSGFSGATIIRDGKISLILDVYELVNMTIGMQTKRHHYQSVESVSSTQKAAFFPVQTPGNA